MSGGGVRRLQIRSSFWGWIFLSVPSQSLPGKETQEVSLQRPHINAQENDDVEPCFRKEIYTVCFGHLDLDIVSDFDIRYWDFPYTDLSQLLKVWDS